MGTYSSTQRAAPLLTQAPDKPRKKNVRTLPVPYFTLRQEAMNARSLVAARSRVAISAGSNLKQVRTLNQTRRVRFAQLRPFAIGDSIDEDTLSGEWPANWSLASYEDVGEYYAGKVLKEEQSNNVSGIMQTNVVTAGPTDPIKAVKEMLTNVSGVSVVDSEGVCVGIVSQKDLTKREPPLATSCPPLPEQSSKPTLWEKPLPSCLSTR